LAKALGDPEPLVRLHAAWALGRIGSPESDAALAARALVESDVSVLEELTAARNA
jgi:epoxyqueuosine reductase